MKLTQTDRTDIVTAIQTGNATYSQLGRKYGVSAAHIGHVYRKETGTPSQPMRRFSQQEKETIVAAIQAKQATMTELAKRYEVSITAIAYVFKKLTGNGMKPQLPRGERKTVVAALQSGKATVAELATTFGVHPQTISRVYKRETGTPWHPKLTTTEKRTIVAELLTGAKRKEVAAKYGVHISTIERTFKHQIGKPLRDYQKVVKTAFLQPSRYRAWQTVEKRMYAVFGLNWFNQKVLIDRNGVVTWHDIALFKIMAYSGLRDHKRTPAYPKGQEIYSGDIVQLSTNFAGKETIVIATVAFSRELGMFILPEVDDDPLAMYSNECEILGTIYENPELIPKAA